VSEIFIQIGYFLAIVQENKRSEIFIQIGYFLAIVQENKRLSFSQFQ